MRIPDQPPMCPLSGVVCSMENCAWYVQWRDGNGGEGGDCMVAATFMNSQRTLMLMSELVKSLKDQQKAVKR